MGKLLKKIFGNEKGAPLPQKKDYFPWLNEKKKTLNIDEITNIEEFLED